MTPDDPEWKQSFLDELRQTRLWDTRTKSKEPPRKVPWRFQYRFRDVGIDELPKATTVDEIEALLPSRVDPDPLQDASQFSPID